MLRHFHNRTWSLRAALAVAGSIAFQGGGCDPEGRFGDELGKLIGESYGDYAYA